MAFFGAAYWFTPLNCLDNDFDAPDAAADRDLCRAIVAGKAGLHPDSWGNHDPLTTLPPHFRRLEPPPGYHYHEALPVDPVWEAKHRQRPVEEPKPKPRPPLPAWAAEQPRSSGELELTCDECNAHYSGTLLYSRGFSRQEAVWQIRRLGAVTGWTCIAGRDRCPRCSEIVPPDGVGNGAGAGEGDEQHAESC